MKFVFQICLLICVPVAVAQRPVDYTKFSHSTPKHKSTCNTCHKLPTRAWSKVSQYPDITDYPDHDACVSCHRAQFFRGARPPICAVCHSKTSPRDEARYAFRNPASSSQFVIEFPHDRHQDVIAQQRSNPWPPKLLAHAPQQYNNCTICHAGTFVAPYKASPTQHSSCFNCHWKSQEPVAANCNGCHKLAPSPYIRQAAPNRISRYFLHEGGGEKKQHIAECTTCHINITKSASLRGLKPDVPITSCTECHNKDGLRQDLNKELSALDKNRAFTCVYCHAPDVGKLDPPASHYLIAQRPPITRKDIK
jgi:decaheme cytochrome c component MtrC/MtrF-like protein